MQPRCQQQQTPTTADDIDTPRRLQNGSKPVNLCEGMNVQQTCRQQQQMISGLRLAWRFIHDIPVAARKSSAPSVFISLRRRTTLSALDFGAAQGLSSSIRIGLASCSARLHNRFVQKLVVAQTSRCLEQVQSQCKFSNLNSQSKSLRGTGIHQKGHQR